MSDELTTAAPRAPRSVAPPLVGNDAAGACPYLLAAGGAWRSAAPSREHRCTAFLPPTPLASDKQRRLCLTSGHLRCATYLAASTARSERGTPSSGAAPVRWPIPRTTPVVDARVGPAALLAGVVAERRAWQAIPAIILVLALAAVGLSGVGRGQPATGLPSEAPGGGAARTPAAFPTIAPTVGTGLTASVAPTASPAPTATPAPTPPPPTATPAPTSGTTYTVKAGDTLYEIAISFGTSVAAIRELNGLTSNTIRPGLVLRIP